MSAAAGSNVEKFVARVVAALPGDYMSLVDTLRRTWNSGHAANYPGAIVSGCSLHSATFDGRALLDALEGSAFVLDGQRRIVAFGSGFAKFASDNGAPELADPARAPGVPMLDSVQGEQVRNAYCELFDLVEERPLDRGIVTFICDVPDCERGMRMAVTKFSGGRGLLCQCILLSARPRPAVALFDFRARAAEARDFSVVPLLAMCSIFQKVRFPAGSSDSLGEWIAAVLRPWWLVGGRDHSFLLPACYRRWRDEWLVARARA